jgi:uncharacterized membrane protein
MAFALRQPRRAAPARRGDDRAAADERAAAADDRTATSARPGIAARGAYAAGSFVLMVSRLVRLVVWVVVLIIVAGILLRVLDANTSNAIVRDVHDVAKTLVGPFANVFKLHNPKTQLAVNWGLAAVVYLIVGSIIASLIARAAPGRRR